MTIRITGNGVVEYATIGANGQPWRTTIAPGDTERAAQLLSADELAAVQAAWTPAVVESWQARKAAIEAELAQSNESSAPAAEDRLARIEEALAEIATTGKLTRDWATKRRA